MLARTGAPAVDCILQNRDELIEFCEWIDEQRIRSYLEIGIWTGRLLTFLHRVFAFDVVAACDTLEASSCGLTVSVPADAKLFVGDSHSAQFSRWRAELGSIDLVVIDGDHSYEAVHRDFEIQRSHPHRFLAFHDIVGADASTAGVRRFWDERDDERIEIVQPHRELGGSLTMGIGILPASSGAT
ncbi:MAG TPA: class I SAM-dependent methyltransferase [Dongiaceae bacterium]|nr:class I SAM-dependent methyltransferase [Dongiaceae bacterium]